MHSYQKPTKVEYAIISKKNYFSELLFEAMGKIIQPAANLLIGTAGLCIFLIFLNTITNNEKYIIAISTYVGPLLFFVGISLVTSITVIIIFSNLLVGSLIDTSGFFEKSKDIIEPTDKIIKHLKYIHTLISVIYGMNKFIITLFRNKSNQKNK